MDFDLTLENRCTECRSDY